jgi:hypothetical protein
MGSRSAGSPTQYSDDRVAIEASGLHHDPHPAGGHAGRLDLTDDQGVKRRLRAPGRPANMSSPIGPDRRLMQLAASADTVHEVSNGASGPVEAFRAQTASGWSLAAPDRINVISEHTDYNDGYVMPFALAQRVLIAAAPRNDHGT